MHYFETEAALRKHEATEDKNFLGTVDLKDNAYIFYVDFLDEFRHCFEGQWRSDHRVDSLYSISLNVYGCDVCWGWAVSTPGRNYFFYAADDKTMKEWIQEIGRWPFCSPLFVAPL